MTSDVQDLINTVQDLNALLASYYASLSSVGIDESQTAEIQDNIKHTLDNIKATQAALNSALSGVHAQAAATLAPVAVDPALTAGTEVNVSPEYKTPVKMVGLNTGSITPRSGTVMKLFDLRGVSSSGPVAPKGGGLWHDGDSKLLIPFVGFDPDVSVNVFTWSDDDQDWVCPTFDPSLGVRQGPSHTLQFRPKGIKDVKKTEHSCTTLPDPIVFNGLKAPSADLAAMKTRTYVELVRRACIKRGFFNEFVIPDAHNPAGNDLFKKHSRFSIMQIKEYVANQRLICDPFAETNYVWSGTLLLSTLHPDLYAKVIQEVGVSPSGPEVFIATMKEVHNGAHYEQMEQLKESFKLLKLSDFSGENVQEANEKVKDIMDQLDGADMLSVGDHLLLHQVGLYEQSTSEHMRLWAVNEYNSVEAFVTRCRQLDPGSLASLPRDQVIDYLTLADRSTTKYLELVGRGRYTPAVTTKQETESGPVAMIAQITKQVTKNIKDSIRTTKGKQTHVKTGGQQRSGKSSDSTGGDSTTKAAQHRAWMTKQGFPAGRNEWRTFFPPAWDPATAGLRHQGKRWKWCSTCAKWMLHHADKHDEWVASSNDRTKDKTKENTTSAGSASPTSKSAASKARANLAVIECDENDGDSVGTWTGVMI
jgi:hypothetical protein